MNIRQRERIFFTHAITILSLFTYYVCDEKVKIIVHYATSAMKRFLTSVSLQHEPKASDVITLAKKTFFARVSYEILYHEV